MQAWPKVEGNRHMRGCKTGGRKRGTPNKINATLKEAILLAATNAGQGDMVAYLTEQAVVSPASFLTLLGKVLPSTITADDGEPVQVLVVTGVPRCDENAA